MIAKAELHVHIEGTLTPSLVSKIAKRNKLSIPTEIFADENTFKWNDFLHFLKVYDVASQVLRTPEDYRDMFYEYLKACASQGAIYVEMMLSPDHARLCGLSFQDHLDGSIQGVKDAKKDFDIEGRIISTCVRHFGIESCVKVAEQTALHPHPLLVGFGMGGDEIHFPAKDFALPFQIAEEAGLGCTNHAGEMLGPESVWDSITYLPVSRIGHGVRSVEDPELLRTLIERNITLEVCPNSNIALKVYPEFAQHPLRKLMDDGVKITLNSDDPPYFNTTLGKEYETAQKIFGFTDAELKQVTHNAIEASFADAKTKETLMAKIS